MVPRLIWSPRALADLGHIARYIARSNRVAAERFCLRLLAQVEALPAFPRCGRVVPELGRESIRELVFPPYRIVYELAREDVIEILIIWHSARGTPDL